ncbi:hypothetical protein PR048_001418, partial [Dryococelus australis]
MLVHATAKTALEKCKTFVQELGKPTTVLTDKGTQFISEVWSTGLTKMGIRPISISVRHYQRNPSEQSMCELARMLHILCHSKQQSWRNYLPAIEYLHNNVIHESTGQRPTEVYRGTVSRLPFPCLADKPSDSSNYYVGRNGEVLLEEIREHGLHPGNLVLVRVHNVSNQVEFITKKLLLVFSGPYRISKVIQENCMKLVGEDNEQVVERFD